MSKLVHGASIDEREIWVFESMRKKKVKNNNEEESMVKAYNGKEYMTISRQAISEVFRNPNCFNEVFVEYENSKENRNYGVNNLEEYYVFFKKDADELKTITDGKINLYKTGRYAVSALQLFVDTCDIEPEPIWNEEAIILMSASRGALRSARNGYKGTVYKYDFVSFYIYLMIANNYPIKEGEAKTLTKEQFNAMDKMTYGLYFCNIQNHDYRLFHRSKNTDDWYTHMDISYARKHGYKVEIIDDGRMNFLSYEGKLTSGKKLFGKYVDFLFPLKKKGYDSAKRVLNTLWGKLCQKNTITVRGKKKVFADDRIDEFTTNGMKDKTVKVFKRTQPYSTDYARIAPFLISFGRCRTAYFMEESVENLVYCHTDGFYLTKPLIMKDEIKNKMGKELGFLRDEGTCKMYIKNMARKDEIKD